jgi:hypothetical protein
MGRNLLLNIADHGFPAAGCDRDVEKARRLNAEAGGRNLAGNDQVESAWSIITPVLETRDEIVPIDFPNYPAGTWGPEEAEVLITQDGRSWFQPAIQSGKKLEEPSLK